MAQYRIMLASFPYGGWERKELKSWYAELARKTDRDARIAEVFEVEYDDTPITMTRNRAAKQALAGGYDYLLMVDSDNDPNASLGKRHGTVPFWDAAWEFILTRRDRPCMVAAPYVGPPPHENIYAFHWATRESHTKEFTYSLEQYSREHALSMGGISEVGALATGVMLIDVRVFSRLPAEPGKGWFYYEWEDAEASEKASTEDVVFTRNMSLAHHASEGRSGAQVFATWDSWAGHWKQKCCLPPEPASTKDVAQCFKDIVLANRQPGERLMIVGHNANPRMQPNGVPAKDTPAIAVPGREAVPLG